MERLLALTVVLAMTSFASAVTVKFEVDASDRKEQYDPGDIIRINVVCNDFVHYFLVDSITSDNGGIATGPRNLHSIFPAPYRSIGILVNGSPLFPSPFPPDTYVLISDIYGENGLAWWWQFPTPSYYYYFEFEVPNMAEPGFLTIDDYGFTRIAQFNHWTHDWAWEVNNISSLQLNIIPEPATLLLLSLGAVMLRRKSRAK